MLGKWGQEDHKFRASLVYTTKSFLERTDKMVACLSKRKAGVSEAQGEGSENKGWVSTDRGDFTGHGRNWDFS